MWETALGFVVRRNRGCCTCMVEWILDAAAGQWTDSAEDVSNKPSKLCQHHPVSLHRTTVTCNFVQRLYAAATASTLLAVVQLQMTMSSVKGEAAGAGSSGCGGNGKGGELLLEGDVDGALLAYRRWHGRFCSAKGTKRREGVEW